MNWEPTSVPSLAGVDAQAEQGAHHRRLLQEANAALAASPAPALLDGVQTIQRIVLAANPKALRRSVSWWGRLLARDITLQAESEALRSQLGVYVMQARQDLQALADSDQKLHMLGLALHAAMSELGQQSTQLAAHAASGDADVSNEVARRLHYLATLATSLKISASHLELTVRNHREMHQRVAQMLPHVELLLDQQRMLRAGLSERAALQSAVRSMHAVQALQPLSFPDATLHHSTPDDGTPR
ncbi:MAG: hypothetical protein ACTS5I_09550 [Rhodanobacter sp.]